MSSGKKIMVPEFEIVSNSEPLLENIVEDIWYYSANNTIREYIAEYIKKHKIFKNLRLAIQSAAPEYEDTLDKFLVLKE